MKKILMLILSLIFAVSLIGCGGTKEQPKQETKKEVKQEVKEEPLNKINFNGSIDPTTVKTGKKIVVAVEVENLDETKPINGIRLLFSNSKFLEDGLTIANIMNGGVQDGRSVKWNIQIPPKEKRAFQIIGKANKVGSYESVIQIKPIEGTKTYSDKDGNEELNAKFTVTQ